MSDLSKEFVESVSEMLSELLVKHEGVRSGEVPLDQLALSAMREAGRLGIEAAFNRLGRESEREFRRDGYELQRAPVVGYTVAFGKIHVRSPYLTKQGTKGGVRPLRERYGVHGGRCSAVVNRWSTDFGLERSFNKAEKALLEHHGISIGLTTIRARTLATADKMQKWQDQGLEDAPGAEASEEKSVIFVEMDGCHLPVVRWLPAGYLGRSEHPRDKLLPLCEWKEVRTGIARVAGEVTPLLICRRDTYDEIALRIEGLVNQLGGGATTQIVAIGDGAIGLKEALERRFPNLIYILDIRHLQGHLYVVADAIGVDDRETWVAAVVALLAAGGAQLVLDGLEPIAAAEVKRNAGTDTINVVQNFLLHLKRFRNSVHYDKFAANEWPIGSGEVESAHRYVPQERMKKAGAWWLREHLNPMLAARAVRANGRWDEFWKAAA